MKRFIFAIGAMLLLNICCFADGPSDDIYQKFETDRIVENIPYQAKELVDQIVSDRLTLDKLINVSPIKIKEIFKETGLIYPPELIKMFHKIGELQQEDDLGHYGQPTQEELTPAQILYGPRN